MDPTAELLALIEAVLDELDPPPGWTKIVVVGEAGLDAGGLVGYLFDGEGRCEVAELSGPGSRAALQDLQRVMAAPHRDRRGWQAVQLRIGSNGDVGTEFDFHRGDRWRADDANRDDLIAAFSELEV